MGRVHYSHTKARRHKGLRCFNSPVGNTTGSVLCAFVPLCEEWQWADCQSALLEERQDVRSLPEDEQCEPHQDQRGDVPLAESVAMTGVADELEQRAGGTAVFAIGHGDEERSDEAHDGDGERAPAGHADQPCVKGLHGVEVHVEPEHGDQDHGDQERPGDAFRPAGHFGRNVKADLGTEPVGQHHLKRAVGAIVMAVELTAEEDGDGERQRSQKNQHGGRLPRDAMSGPADQEALGEHGTTEAPA